MKKKVGILVLTSTVLLSLVLLFFNCEILKIYDLPEALPMTYSDVQQINDEKIFGNNITADIVEKTSMVGGEKITIKTLVFKLFGIFPIKSVEANLVDEEQVYLGGNAVGFSIDVNGLIVLGSNSVLTEDGPVDTIQNSKLKRGDIIVSINGIEVSSVDDLHNILESESYNGEELKLKVLRNKELLDFTLKPVFDEEDNEYKVGLWVKSDAAGVGTLTYVDSDTLEFGALGHPITDYDTGSFVPAKSGKIFPCNIVGLEKGEKGSPGEIKAVFMQGKNQKGTIEKNTEYGVFGKIDDKSKIVDLNKTAEVASRLTVKPGKATIVSCISGVSEEYEIEIIKANYQPSSSSKSFVFRVTDKKLLELTGGIIQGMSGSPIMQNGKIIGAVTHVFVSDPTKGYGVYIDWMMAA